MLVTGGNRNTGLWLVKKFVDEGAKVFMCGSTAASTATGVEKLKGLKVEGVTAQACDVGDRVQIKARRRANCPLGMEAKGEDIANVVAFLASEDSGNMAGEIVTCDAGCSCQHMPKDVDF